MAFRHIIWLLFLMHLRAARSATYDEFLATTLPDLCPYSTFCTMGPSKQITNKKHSSCCKPCSCDDDCLINGNCCPDSVPVAAHKEPPSASPTAKCAAPTHYVYDGFENQLVRQHLYLGFYFHYITSTCPERYSDQKVNNKCTNASIENLWDNAIVSDSRGRAFSNRYCAECNDVQTYTRWDLKLICKLYTDTLTDVHNIQELNDKSCMVISSPPSTSIGKKSRCFPVGYNNCNATGHWDKFDSNLERACAVTTFPYVSSLDTMDTYNNIYCYLCNRASRDAAIIKYTCQSDKHKMDDFKTGRIARFSALLMPPTFTKRTRCQPSEIFDYRFEKCRPLHCPFSLLPRNGECLEVFKETTGMNIFVQIEAKYTDQDTLSNIYGILDTLKNDDTAIHHFESIANHLYTSINIENYPCGQCNSHSAIRKDNTSIAFSLGFHTSRQCPPSRITGMVNKWRMKPNDFHVGIGAQLLAFTPELAYDPTAHLYNDQRFIETISLFHHKILCTGMQYTNNWLKPKFHCPHVDIHSKDYLQLLSSHNTTHVDYLSEFTAICDDMDNADPKYTSSCSYRICVDNYLPRNNKGTSGNSCLVGRIVTATLLAIVLVCW